MPSAPVTKVFNIPFSGGAAMVVCVAKATVYEETAVYALVTEIRADGTINDLTAGDLQLSISVSGSIITVSLTAIKPYIITDCRCSLIPGDPFA